MSLLKPRSWRASLTTRTLLQLSVAVGGGIIAAAAIAYALVFHSVEQHELQRLEQCLSERVTRLEDRMAIVPKNLYQARDEMAKRYAQSDAADFLQLWPRFMHPDDDGAWRSATTGTLPFENVVAWVHRDAPTDAAMQRQLLIMAEVCERFQLGWKNSFDGFYAITSDCRSMVGFDSVKPGWIAEQEADDPVEQDEFAMISTLAANPQRVLRWTGVNTDDDSPLISAALPVDINGVHVMTVAYDLDAEHLIADIQSQELAEMKSLIFRTDGRMIAFPGEMENVTDIDDLWEVDMASSSNAEWRALYAAYGGRKEHSFSGYDAATDQHFVAQRMAGPDWIYMATLPRGVLRRAALENVEPLLWAALATLLLELLLLSSILRRSIARPIGALVAATKQLSADASTPPLATVRRDELGELANAFNDMAQHVQQRDAALRHEKERLEHRVAERTVELEAALAQQTELAKLKTDFVSLVSHEFRTPLGIIMSASDVLERYFGRLQPEKRARHLQMIINNTRNLAALIEEVLLLGRVEEGRLSFSPVPLELDAFCRKLCDEMRSATKGSSPIRYTAENSIAGAISDEPLLRHILSNLLSNAVKYSQPGGAVDFTAKRDGDDVVFAVQDHGIGIPKEEQAKLFTSFTRASNVGQRQGTGLGLVVVQRCVTCHGGSLDLVSELGQGTIVKVRLPVFPPNPSNPTLTL